MTPGEFIAKWRASELKESSAAQEHFIDLCRLLGETSVAFEVAEACLAHTVGNQVTTAYPVLISTTAASR